MKEIWKDVVGYEGFYQVSNLGRIKSVKRKCLHNYGGLRTVNERILKQGLSKGYSRVVLSIDSKKCTKTVHRLVAIHFIENPQNKPEVNHKDGIKKHNRFSNLEWSTSSENEQHAYNNGLATTHSEYHHSAKLTNKEVSEIRIKLSDGHKGRELANQYNVSESTISVIKRNAKWRHIK